MLYRLFSLSTLTLFLCAPPAAATTIVEMDLHAMSTEADLVVTGRCVEVASLWLRGELVTRITVDIEETFKGEATSPVKVIVPGGFDANRKIPIASVVPGAPEIDHGEALLLFLSPEDTDGYRRIIGFAQGKFRLVPGPSGSTLAARDLSELRVAGREGIAMGDAETFPLAEIRAAVDSAVAASGGTP